MGCVKLTAMLVNRHGECVRRRLALCYSAG
jgi:hypothetical protein